MPVRYCVATVEVPNPEPFMVLKIDPDSLGPEGGVLCEIVSFHMNEDEAHAAAQMLGAGLH